MTDQARALDDVVNGGDVAMVTTIDTPSTLTSRPMTIAAVARGHVDFLVDVTADWIPHAEGGRPVNVAVSSGGRNDWVSLTGTATVDRDRSRIEELWNPAAGAYFDDASDPNIGVLRVDVSNGEYWSAPAGGPVGRLVHLVSAALGDGEGDKPGGDTGPVTST